MKVLRVYNAKSMNPESNNKNNKDGIVCSSVILAIEFIPDRNSVAVSLSDRTIAFYDFGGSARKFDRKLHVPST
jgi:WD40 repeat protein